MGLHQLELNLYDVYSAYLINGALEIEGKEMEGGDFMIVKEQDSLEIIATTESKLFVIQSPLIPGYQTYTNG